MKLKSYIESKKVTFEEVYGFLMGIQRCCENEVLQFILDESLAIDDIVLMLNNYPKTKRFIFNKVVMHAKQSNSYQELERYVVYMKRVFGYDYVPLCDFKQALFYMIMNSKGHFSAAKYCVIRHLVDLSISKLDDLIEYAWNKKPGNQRQYHECLSEIYLIEKEYDKAIVHLEYVDNSKIKEMYRKELQRHIFFKYMFDLKSKKYYQKICLG